MATGKQAAEEMKAAFKEVYDRDDYSFIFGGGNIGMAFLGLCVKEAGMQIAASITTLAASISSQDAPINPYGDSKARQEKMADDLKPKQKKAKQ